VAARAGVEASRLRVTGRRRRAGYLLEVIEVEALIEAREFAIDIDSDEVVHHVHAHAVVAGGAVSSPTARACRNVAATAARAR
jgi:hypothetical protein